MTAKLLAGVRVVELTEVWAGPMAGSLLGDLGADVVKIESFPRTSITRPPGGLGSVGEGEGPAYERSPIHQLANRNKRNIALNLGDERGAEVLTKLLAEADIFFEGYSAGTVERLGFGWERVRELNPRCSLISMPGWGVAGPYEGYVTLGSGLDSTVGHWSVRGYPGRPREDVQQIYHSDATGALTLVFATVASLQRRAQTGEGSFIDLSQTEALAWQLPGIFAEYTMNGRVPGPLGNADPHVVPHNVYRAAAGLSGEDAWIAIAAETDAQWAGLAAALGHEEWAADGHPWSTVHGRLAARDAIDVAIGEFIATQVAEDAAEAIRSAGGLATAVAAPVSVVASPQHIARDWLEEVHHPIAGVHRFPGFLWRTSPDATSWDRYAALVGEHNHEVLSELGYDAASIDALFADGVIGDRYE